MLEQSHVITLRVELDAVTPPVWRRIEVDAGVTLRSLHHIIQAAFGWTSQHPHAFVVDGRTYTRLDHEPRPVSFHGLARPARDDRLAALRTLASPGQRFSYQYDVGDAGDRWTHTVTVEKIAARACEIGGGHIVDGQRACPPEDVGGPGGYEDFLEAVWGCQSFDPEVFDKRQVNNALLRMGANGWGK